MNDLIFNNRDFGLRYDLDTKIWQLIFDTNLNLVDPFNIGRTGDISNQKLDSSWLLSFTTDTEKYTVLSRNLSYIFESDKKIRFYYDKTNKVFDTKTNKIIKDKISILNINTIPDSPYTPLNYSIDWEIINEFIGNDGYIDTKKIEITFKDSNDDGVVDDPDIFNLVVSPSTTDLYKFVVLKKYETSTGQIDYAWIENIGSDGNILIHIANTFTNIPSNYFIDKKYVYVYDTDTLFQYDMLLNKFVVSLDYKVYQGRKGLKFHYIHSADYEARIDPGYSNFMDLYVLTKQYDISFRQWLLGSIDQEPMPPSTDQLAITLGSKLEQIKAMSDEIIYHPIRYKILFGAKAISNLRASFKLVKNQEQIISDNDLKSRVLNSINEFFSLENWDFGDSFYFSELVAYIMNRTAPFLVNIVIVPRQENLTFGSLFEIKAENDQIFISGATSEDLEIIDSITTSSLNATGFISTNNTVLSQQFIESRVRDN
ncbi:MAG: hypothetical protein EBS49_00975 [Verrucomicrobia bacterium]|nr:hypothetical protein [Verrucomicrobiota bacterium]